MKVRSTIEWPFSQASIVDVVGGDPIENRFGRIPVTGRECAFEEQTGIPGFLLNRPVGLSQCDRALGIGKQRQCESRLFA